MSKLEEYADQNQLDLYKSFPTTHFLSNPENVLHVMAWTTFWRRNMHRFAEDYLQIKLYQFQQISLYEMGIVNLACVIASRNAAKSFLIALYACCRCILYPGEIFTIGSSTMGQAKLIVSEKIQNELYVWSPILRSEISKISTNPNDTYVKFRNGSRIIVYVANENARGRRSNASCREEFRMIKKWIEDKVISPFQTPRRPEYILSKDYSNNPALYEPPVDIYISSSYIDNGDVWMWKIVDNAVSDMVNGGKSVLLAFDDAIILKHRLKLKSQLLKEKRKQDPISWKTEYLNLRVKDSISSYFTYSMLTKAQRSENVFYPRKAEDVRNNVKKKYAIPRQDNEIRVISNDIAFVAGSKNDNSVYCCIRAIPETTTVEQEDGEIEIKQGYLRQYPYMESNQLGDTTKQAIRIRQLYEDFHADYIVLDTRNGGIQILYTLQQVLYDKERGVEYPPLKCMNNDVYAKSCADNDATPCIFAISANQTLNSDIAVSFRQKLIENKIEFLVNCSTAIEEILSNNKEYQMSDAEDQVDYFERPFLENQAMISECAELQYEKIQGTTAIKIYERGSNRKDRYTAASYGSYFIDWLEVENRTSLDDYAFTVLVN